MSVPHPFRYRGKEKLTVELVLGERPEQFR